MAKHKGPAGLATLTLFAFGMRVFGASASIAYIPDTDIIREAFGIAQGSTLGHLYDVYYKYPLTLPIYVLGTYGTLFAAGFVTGIIPSMEAFADLAFSNRESMHLIAVLSLAVLGAASVPTTYLAARSLNKSHSGWVAAVWVTFSLVLVHFGHHARPHVPLATLSLVAIMLLVKTARGANWPWTIAATVVSALTFGALLNGVVIALSFGLAWFFRARSHPSASTPGYWKLLLINAALFVALCLLLNPSFFSRLLLPLINTTVGLPLFEARMRGTYASIPSKLALSHLGTAVYQVFIYQPLAVAVGAAGIPYLFWKLRKDPAVLAVAASFPLMIALGFGLFSQTYPRMFAVLAPYSILSASYLVEDAILWTSHHFRWRRSLVLVAFVSVLFIPLIVTALRLVYVTAQTDTRTLASHWIRNNVATGTAILGNFQLLELTPTVESLRRQARDYPESLGSTARWFLRQPKDAYPSGPRFDILDALGYSLLDPPVLREVIEKTRVHFVIYQTYRTPASRLLADAPMLRLMEEMGEPIRAFCPGREVSEVYLPADIREPVWRHVWNVQRPGPIVVIFAVSPKANWKGIASPFCGEDTVGADHDSDAEPTKEQPAASSR